MTALNKQALRLTAEKAKDNFMPNFMVPTRDVLALLDELEAKDTTIAFQQHEIRTLLGRLENANRAAAAGKGATS
ncbi:hypothetical protein HV135_10520 [Citrobacter sp. RHBSTW-00229]|uniref:hypothetical protein n=1 Tax=Citrobacter sp. RHBSTW-00229 TaxID=2742641 RepID=UPI0015E93128|nr:hypothetical protein [Citrobacter sp. RHBSTW-00229]QLX39596.1 hypothetical protein HV135_10520 [Citrobacter sp. RHBSTW-00229]